MSLKIDKQNVKDVFPMSDIQKGMVYHSLKDLDVPVYHNQISYQLEDNRFNPELFKSALTLMVEKHPMLRTGFLVYDFDEPLQVVYKKFAFDIRHENISHMDTPRQEEYIGQWMKGDRQRAFDVKNARPPWRIKIFGLGSGQHFLIWACHHAIMDGWSSASLSTELHNTYLQLKKNPRFVPGKLKSTYKDFVIEQDVEKKKKENIHYWKQKLHNYQRLHFPGTHAGGKKKYYIKNLGKKHLTELDKAAQKYHTSVKNMCIAAYVYMLNLLSYEKNIVVGLVTHNRPLCQDGDKILGCFLNTVPFCVKLPGGMKWLDYLGLIDNDLRDLAKYNRFSLLEIVKIIGDETQGQNPIFDTIFTFTDFHVYRQLDKSSPSSLRQSKISSFSLQKHARTNTFFDFFVDTTSGELIISANYTDSIISEDWVIRLFGCFEQVLHHLIFHPGKPVSNLDLMPACERQKLLYDFNDTAAGYPRDKTIDGLFEDQAGTTPDRLAMVGPKLEKGGGNISISYRELNSKSNRLARELIEKGPISSIVGIMVERSVEMIIGILGILKAGSAYLPIDPDYPPERIHFMLADSSAAVLVTTHSLSQRITVETNIVYLEDDKGTGTDAGTDSRHQSSDPAYILYTSGTTGQPKGMMIQHKNVVRLMINDRNLFDFNDTDTWTMFHSYCFDFSVWEMYGALLFGGKLVIIPAMQARDPGSYLELLRKEQVTVLNQTPSAFYNLINQEIKQGKGDLNIRWVIFGGEALKPAKLKPWQSRYPRGKLVNMFGITETTVHVTYKQITAREIESDISNIGKPIPTTTCWVLDSNLDMLPIGVVGELCVGGDGVGRGYLKREQLTRQKFIANPFKAGERLYRSGDLVRMLDNGEMEYLGRLDHQVQLRGFRIELGEIENRLLKHHEITEALVKAKTGENGDQYLCAYYVSVSGQPLAPAQLREYLSGELPAYMIPSYFVPIEKIPLTPNGKIDVKALPLPGPSLENGSDNEAPHDEVEEQLVEIWQNVLSLEKIGVKDSYFTAGGDSIKAIKLVSEINEALETNIKIVDLYANETIEKLSGRVVQARLLASDNSKKEEVLRQIGALKNRVLSRVQNPAEIEDLYPMSDIEKGMIFYYMKHAGSGIYHDQFVYSLRYKNFDVHRFKKAFSLLAEKHEVLRSSFNIEDFEEPVRLIHKIPRLDVEDFDISHHSPGEQEEYINRLIKEDRENPFNPDDYPLWRMRLFMFDEEHLVVVFIFHHAILDGWSVASLAVELNNTYMQLYARPGFVPDKLKSSYKEVVVTEMIEKQRPETIDYWKNELADYKRLDFFTGSKSNDRMVSYPFALGPALQGRLQRIARQYHTSLNHLCFAAYLYLVRMISYENDIVVGKVTNNRPVSEDGEKLLGCFLNTVPVRIRIPPGITWKDYIRVIENKLKEIKGYEWMSLFEISRSIGEKSEERNPLFDTLFNFMDFHVLEQADQEEDIDTGTAPPADRPPDIPGGQDTNTLFDFEIDTTRGRFNLIPKYNRSAIGDEMVEKLCRYFQRILETIIHQPGRRIDKDEIIPTAEKQQLLYEFNDTAAGYSRGKTLHWLFQEQVERTPGNTAVICDGDRRLTYSRLNRRSNQLARFLRQKGIGPSRLAGIIIDRSLEMIVGVMGVLKAGGAYVPIEPYLPGERIRKLLANLALDCIITNRKQFEKIDRLKRDLPGIKTIACLDLAQWDHDGIGTQPPGNLPPTAAPSDPAYVIFTSGSTGVPKGVMVEHPPVVNVIEWVNRTFAVKGSDKLLFITSLAFDLSVYDIFGILSSGASIRLVEAGDIKAPRRLLEIIMEEGITFWDSAPAALQQLTAFFPEVSAYPRPGALRLVFLSGDWIPVTLPGMLKQTFEGVRVISLGGATEATIWSNYYPIHRVDPSWNSIPYGKPIRNASYYILDPALKICPRGVAGDLYIGGECLAAAYINDIQLTAAKFLSNPYVPGEKIYKTGDIARWFGDGHDQAGSMEFLGRKDQQVKIRGFRVELGEIESHLSKYEEIEECIVLLKQDKNSGSQYICAYYVPDVDLDKEDLKKHLLRNLPEYMLPGRFVPMAGIPLTPNGKVDRKSLPEPETPVETGYIAPRHAIERCLVDIWSGVLGLDKVIIGIDANFFELGGHSLNATVMAARVHKELNVKLPLAEIFKTPTIRELSGYITGAVQDRYSAVEAVEKREYYNVSSAQKRLYILQQMELESTAYNIPEVIPLPDEPDVRKLEETFKKMILRHESLRTSFHMIANRPVQRIHKTVEFEIEYFDLAAKNAKNREGFHHSITRPFDLSRVPLLRVELIKKGENNTLLVDIHHIISDGVSRALLKTDFTELYNGRQMQGLRIQYKDFSEWQNSMLKSGSMQKQEDYWLKRFNDRIPAVNLPPDYTDGANEPGSFDGKGISFSLGRDLSDRINRFTLETGVTTYMVLLAAFNILLSKYTEEEDIVVGVPVFNRRHADLLKIIGMFVNMLAMRNYPQADKTFAAFLKEVKENALDAYENQDYQFEQLVWKLDEISGGGSHLKVNVVFVMESLDAVHRDTDTAGDDTPGAAVKPYESGTNVARFDLTLASFETKEEILLEIEYSGRLFMKQTIERMAGHFTNILQEVITDPGIKISEVSIKEGEANCDKDKFQEKEINVEFDF